MENSIVKYRKVIFFMDDFFVDVNIKVLPVLITGLCAVCLNHIFTTNITCEYYFPKWHHMRRKGVISLNDIQYVK